MFTLDAFQKTLDKLIAVLSKYQVRFHLTGGITSSIYGIPRMTQDVDLVIDNEATTRHMAEICSELEVLGYLVNRESISKSLENKSMFQLYDTHESLKLDVYPRELIAGELSRSVEVELFPGMAYPVVSLEDAAISKLVWVNLGSHKSRSDIKSIFRSANEQQQVRI